MNDHRFALSSRFLFAARRWRMPHACRSEQRPCTASGPVLPFATTIGGRDSSPQSRQITFGAFAGVAVVEIIATTVGARSAAPPSPRSDGVGARERDGRESSSPSSRFLRLRRQLLCCTFDPCLSRFPRRSARALRGITSSGSRVEILEDRHQLVDVGATRYAILHVRGEPERQCDVSLRASW
jgi:hypothetical protein